MDTKQLISAIGKIKYKGLVKNNAALAIAIGSSESTISNMLAGRVPVSAKIEKALKEKYPDLFNENQPGVIDDCAQKLLHAEKQIELMSKTISALEDHIATLKKQKN